MGCSCASKGKYNNIIRNKHDRQQALQVYSTQNSLECNKEEPQAKIPELEIKRKWIIHSKKNPIKQDYKIIKELGQGSFGCVILAEHKVTQQLRAIKCIHKHKVEDIEHFQNEVNILCALDHPNVIKLIETYESSSNLFLVTELCKGGELFNYIANQSRLTEYQAVQVMKQIISAVRYCHSQNICHRDIKPENFLLANENDDQQIKLIDFGLSKKVNKETIMTSIDGTVYYIAPEVINQSYTYHCDNWSLGILLYVMLTGNPPFNGKNNYEILENILKQDVSFQHPAFKIVSNQAKDLISKLLNKDIQQRYTAEQAYNHPWIQQNIQSSLQQIAIPEEILSNLESFLNSQKLKRATLTYIACKISEDDIQQLKNAFIKLDQNGDGTLTREELEKGMSEIGKQIDKKVLDDLIKVMDTNQNGYLDYTEFIAACLSGQQYVKENILKEAFQAMDIDKSGKITIGELKEFFKGGQDLSQKELKKIITEVDKDKDGTISYIEFLEMMRDIKK